jgi:hypothetical protein
MRLAAISQIDQYWISDEVKSNFPGSVFRIKMASHGVRYLILKLAQIPPLSRDPALTSRGIPRSYQESGFVAGFDLK